MMPNCCYGCPFRGTDYNEYTDTNSEYCERNLILPTKKQSCKVKDKAFLRRRENDEIQMEP